MIVAFSLLKFRLLFLPFVLATFCLMISESVEYAENNNAGVHCPASVVKVQNQRWGNATFRLDP